ncbi:MAG: nickel-dependent lactate racemase [candidate division KSB1 bacterium]|nr:nickel-dependent lactate racemase [candidate division KSB1 bacterium]
MTFSLPYGRGRLTCKLNDVTWKILEPETMAFESRDSEIDACIEKCVQQVYEQKVNKLLLVVPDHTRRCSLDQVLPALLQRLQEKVRTRVEILVANGSHVLQDESVIRELLSENIWQRYPVFQHDCRDDDQLVKVGETDGHTPIMLNKRVVNADLVITLGGVLYHYFAGFGGGAKMILPGTSGHETIRRNHQRTIDARKGRFHPGCREGNLNTNPVFQDLRQIVKFVPNWISLQWLVAPNGAIIKSLCGPVLEEHRKICDQVERFYSIPIKEKADIVVASAGGEPTDINLIQTHKSIHHAFQAVKDGGVLVIAAQCRQGVGSRTFMPYFDHGSSKNMAAALLENYQINGHTALALKEKTEAVQIVLLSELDPELVRKTGMVACKNCEMLKTYLKKANPETGYYFPQAQMYVPVMIR